MSENNGNGNGKPRTRREEYEQATAGLKFAKDFMTAIEAVMRDEMAPIGQRIMAWIKYTSWGRYCLFCVNEDGTAASQSDCARDLGIDRRRVSDTFRYFEMRGYLERRGSAKVVYPAISPDLGINQTKGEEDVNMSGALRTFLELWRVQCAPDNSALQVHLAEVKRILKVRSAMFEAWRADGTNPGASLIDSEITEDVEVEEKEAAAGGPVRVYTESQEENPPARPPGLDSIPQELAKRGIYVDDQDLASLKAELRDTPSSVFLGVVDDRLARGPFGFPVLLQKAAQARNAYERLQAMPKLPDRMRTWSDPEPDPPPPDPDEDPVTATRTCHKCFGRVDIYASGKESLCGCALRLASHA